MTGSSESTLSHGWNGWSGSDDLPMRRTRVTSSLCSAWFMTPMLGKAENDAFAPLAAGGSTVLSTLGVAITLGSASSACKQSALPEASSVKGISPPSCRKSALSAELVAFGAALRAVLVPVVAFAPPARGPLVAPFFVCFRAWAFRIGGLSAGFLSAVLCTAHCECVCCARVGFELAPHVADLSVAQHAACGADSEGEVAYARVE
eukprot:6213890-Pleurochrysis_carterae.AAC.3